MLFFWLIVGGIVDVVILGVVGFGEIVEFIFIIFN